MTPVEHMVNKWLNEVLGLKWLFFSKNKGCVHVVQKYLSALKPVCLTNLCPKKGVFVLGYYEIWGDEM